MRIFDFGTKSRKPAVGTGVGGMNTCDNFLPRLGKAKGDLAFHVGRMKPMVHMPGDGNSNRPTFRNDVECSLSTVSKICFRLL